MGKKGTPHRKWSKEEKLRFIRLHLDEHISITEIERKYVARKVPVRTRHLTNQSILLVLQMNELMHLGQTIQIFI